MGHHDNGLLLIDVDGPLNPYRAKPTRRPDGYETFRYTYLHRTLVSGSDVRRHKGIRLWLNPGHGAMLLDLAAESHLTPVWCTTWGARANQWIGPAIGLPQLPVIPFPDEDLDPDGGWRDRGAWKWAAVSDYAAGRPLAWLDDELDSGNYPAARADFDRTRAGIPTLLCTVDPSHGLTPEHLTSIRSWMEMTS